LVFLVSKATFYRGNQSSPINTLAAAKSHTMSPDLQSDLAELMPRNRLEIDPAWHKKLKEKRHR